MLECLDAAAVRRWCTHGLSALRRHQHEINELNVFPVPDGDTGTNLVFTLSAAEQALAAGTDPPGEAEPVGMVLRRLARGALLGARGSSGLIVSQLLQGSADALAAAPAARGRLLAEALTAGAKAGYAAVADPVEGTVLTVATAAAGAALATDSDDLAAVVQAASAAAAAALARTPEQLPALARAGVVDAGGRGLVVLLDALVEVVTGRIVPAGVAAPAGHPASLRPLTVARETGSSDYTYEVQYLLDADPSAVHRLRRVLDGLGDSLVVVGIGADGPMPTWNVHVHVNDVGAAIEAGIEAGRPHRIAVTRFADQIAAQSVPVGRAGRPAGGVLEGRRVVVVTYGAGLAEVFASEGAVVVDGGPTNSPSIGDVLSAVRAAGAAEVVVLPNDHNIHAIVAAAADEARADGIRVQVVPTRSPVQALAAIAIRDPARAFDDDVIAMAEAAGACRFAELTFATRDALTIAGRCAAGDVLALVEGEVNLIGTDLRQTCLALVDRLLAGGGELVTMILGSAAPDDLDQQVRRHVSEHWPFVEVHTYDGGQPHYPVLLGVE